MIRRGTGARTIGENSTSCKDYELIGHTAARSALLVGD